MGNWFKCRRHRFQTRENAGGSSDRQIDDIQECAPVGHAVHVVDAHHFVSSYRIMNALFPAHVISDRWPLTHCLPNSLSLPRTGVETVTRALVASTKCWPAFTPVSWLDSSFVSNRAQYWPTTPLSLSLFQLTKKNWRWNGPASPVAPPWPSSSSSSSPSSSTHTSARGGKNSDSTGKPAPSILTPRLDRSNIPRVDPLLPALYSVQRKRNVLLGSFLWFIPTSSSGHHSAMPVCVEKLQRRRGTTTTGSSGGCRCGAAAAAAAAAAAGKSCILLHQLAAPLPPTAAAAAAAAAAGNQGNQAKLVQVDGRQSCRITCADLAVDLTAVAHHSVVPRGHHHQQQQHQYHQLQQHHLRQQQQHRPALLETSNVLMVRFPLMWQSYEWKKTCRDRVCRQQRDIERLLGVCFFHSM